MPLDIKKIGIGIVKKMLFQADDGSVWELKIKKDGSLKTKKIKDDSGGET